MQLGRVTGTLVSSRKEPLLEGLTFLVVRQINADNTDTNSFVVAADAVGAVRLRQFCQADRPDQGPALRCGDHGDRRHVGGRRRDGVREVSHWC